MSAGIWVWKESSLFFPTDQKLPEICAKLFFLPSRSKLENLVMSGRQVPRKFGKESRFYSTVCALTLRAFHGRTAKNALPGHCEVRSLRNKFKSKCFPTLLLRSGFSYFFRIFSHLLWLELFTLKALQSRRKWDGFTSNSCSAKKMPTSPQEPSLYLCRRKERNKKIPIYQRLGLAFTKFVKFAYQINLRGEKFFCTHQFCFKMPVIVCL